MNHLDYLLGCAAFSAGVKRAELRPGVQLKEPQERAVERVMREPGVLAYHGLGSGKTLTSIAAGERLGGPVEVVVPASLRENYKKELQKFVKGTPRKYNVESYQKAISYDGLPPAKLTVFDEAHRMGQEGTAASQLPAKAQGKVMLLTGTPLRNEPSELLPLLRAIAKDRPIPKSQKSFDIEFLQRKQVGPGFWGWLRGIKPGVEVHARNLPKLRKLVQGRVDYAPSVGAFPSVKREDVHVEMSPEQTSLYKSLMNANPGLSYKVRSNLPPSRAESQQLNAFLSAVRQVSNNPAAYDITQTGTPTKVKRMVGEIQKRHKEDPDFRGLAYSNYLEAGINPLAKELEKLKIPHAVFTGEIKDEDRRQLVQDYNAGKYKMLLISGAGAEGLDLKGTRLVQIMEPHWNQARIEQVIGRAVRHKSHEHLPAEKQNVTVQQYYAKPQPNFLQRWGIADPETGADEYLQTRSLEKQKLIDQFLTLLKEVGSEPIRNGQQR